MIQESPSRFAQLLTIAIQRIRNVEGKKIAVIQDELGYLLGREGGSTIEYWRKEHLPPRLSDTESLARALVERGRLDRAWLHAFLTSAGHPAPDNLCDEFFAPASGTVTSPAALIQTNVHNEDASALLSLSKTIPLQHLPSPPEPLSNRKQRILCPPEVANHLSASHKALIAHAFAQHEVIYIRRVFVSGYSGAMVLLVSAGPNLPPAVVKLAFPPDLLREVQAYQQYVSRISPQDIAHVQGEPVVAQDGLVGLIRYTFVGGSDAAPALSLFDYCVSDGAIAASEVLNRIFRVFGRHWWANNYPQVYALSEQYDRLLTSHLHIVQMAQPIGVPHRLEAGQASTLSLRTLEVGQFVQLHGFEVTKVQANGARLTLTAPPPPDEAAAWLRVKLDTSVPIVCRPGDRLEHVSGVIIATRQSVLNGIAATLLPAYKPDEKLFLDPSAEAAQKRYGIRLLNPIYAMDELLDQVIDTRFSVIHGDLNLHNVLVESKTGFAWLIDFAETRLGPTVFDLQRLEVQLITKLLPLALSASRLGPETIIDLMVALHQDPPQPTSPHIGLTEPYTLLLTIRRLARQYLIDDLDWDEHYLGLVIALVGALKYDELDDTARRLSLFAAATVRALIGEPLKKPREAIPRPTVAKPPLYVGVPSMPLFFAGREELVERLVQRLVSGQHAAFAAEGLPGVGKTALAVALAHHQDILNHFHDGVLWAGLGLDPDVASSLMRWARALEIDVSNLISVEERSQAIRDAIGQRRLLVIIDDAWDAKSARLLRCGGLNCGYLLTTRNQSIAREFAGSAQVVHVPELEDMPAYQLLQDLAPEAFAADPIIARELIQAVGRLPLAIELLGGYLAAPERSYFPELSEAALQELADPQHRMQLAQQRLGALQSEELTLQETMALSLEGLPESAVNAFFALGAFSPKPRHFDRAAAQAVTGAEATILALLLARNLVERVERGEKEWLTLHQTLSDMARRKTESSAIQRHRDYYLALLNADRENWHQIESVYGQIKQAWQLAAQDETLLDFVNAASLYQERRGLWRDRIDWTEHSIQVATTKGLRRELGWLHNNRADIYYAQGAWQEAILSYEQALAISRETGDRQLEGRALGGVGKAHTRTGQWGEANRYLSDAVAVAEASDDLASEAEALRNLGTNEYYQANFQPAKEFLERAYAIYQRLGDAPGEIRCLNMFGAIAYRLADYTAALQSYEKSMERCHAIGYRWGEAYVLGSLGNTYFDLGHFEVARRFHEDALQICREIGDHEGEAVSLDTLGLITHHLHQSDHGLEYFREALRLQRVMKDRHGQAYTVTHLGYALIELADYKAAAEALEEALKLRQELDEQSESVDTLAGLALIAWKQHASEQALTSVETIVNHIDKNGPDGVESPVQVYLICYQILIAAGQVIPKYAARAQTVLEAAYALLDSRAMRIQDEQFRRSYLENVPVHRELIALWRNH